MIELGTDDQEVRCVADYLRSALAAEPCGLTLEIGVVDRGGDTKPAVAERGAIRLRLADELGEAVGQATPLDEGYELSISDDSIELVATHPAGLVRAAQSLHQLVMSQLPVDADSDELVGGSVVLRALHISDRPRFGWRGMHLDSSRHFFSVDEVKRFLDLLATFKFNVFHWHLTDDQGWRIEIDAYPMLTSVGAKRAGKEPSRNGFYTKDQIRDVIAYAAQRHIDVVPEIDLPGHTRAVLAAHPELSCTGGPFAVSTRWGIHKDVLCLGNPATTEFVERVLAEVVELFSSQYVHLGGDECPVDRWGACVKCRRLVAVVGLTDESELQTWFSTRVADYLAGIGRTAVFWDEVLDGGLPSGVALMSWRGVEYGQRAASLGHDVVMAPESHLYFDYRQTVEGFDPGAAWAEPTTLEHVYGFEPTEGLSDPADIARVLGAQANVWTELIPDMARLESMVLPRMCALAEVLWSEPSQRDWVEFGNRLTTHASWIRSIYNSHESL